MVRALWMVLLLVFPTHSFAQVLGEAEAAWAEGVSPEDQGEARALFREGNGFFERSQYREALVRYREALELWDHPALHFNITVCLINLERPVEAFGHLRRAMRYGREGLGAHHYARAVTYERLLVGRLARLRIECDQAGAEVTLNGQRLLSCPGELVEYVLPGEHQLVANKPGHVPLARALSLVAGEETVTAVELVPLDTSRQMARRWDRWVPWSVVGAGVGAGLLGFGMRALAVSDANEYDREVTRLCPRGCPEETLPESVTDVRSSAELKAGVAVSLFVVAAATSSTGAALLYLNRPREMIPGSPSLTPTSMEDSVGVAFQWAF